MPRAIVTLGLAETLRNIRIQNKIQAKQLASHIGKSPAYVSKLENGSIQTIDVDELYSILQFISGEESQIELAEQIYKSLNLKYSTKEIEDQLWFVNYDTVRCILPIPDSLITDLNSRIESLGITRQYLIDRINANEALSDEDKLDVTIPYNQWYHPANESGNTQAIKIKLSDKELNSILDRKKDVAPYIYIFCIAFYLLKIERFKDIVSLTDDSNIELTQATTSLLNSYKFLSIFQKNKLIAEKQSQEDIQEILSSFDKDNIEILSDIISGFRFASQHNIKATNEQLKAFGENMHWDLGFMLRLISMQYNSLKETSVSNKKCLLSEIEDLIQKYANLPIDQNRIESY